MKLSLSTPQICFCTYIYSLYVKAYSLFLQPISMTCATMCFHLSQLFKLVSRISLAIASMSFFFLCCKEWKFFFLLSIWVMRLLGLDFHRGLWIWNVWILTILPLPFVFILSWSTIIDKIWKSWIMSINFIMCMMQFLTIVCSYKLNKDLNGFYLM